MNGLGAYQETAILTQDRGKIVVMLYEGAIKFLKVAISEIEEGNIEGRHTNICKAMDILAELDNSLNVEAGGEVGENLRRLYNYCLTQLTQANINSDVDAIQDVIEILDELNSGWKEIA